MTDFKGFGNVIKKYRTTKEESLSRVADVLGIDKTYLSKLENGHLQPSRKLLKKICNYFSIPDNEASEIYTLAGYAGKDIVMLNKEREEVETRMEESQLSQSKEAKGVEVNVPGNIAVLYTDSAFVTTNEFGVCIDFAQRLGSTNKHNVVARVGMSMDHAKALVRALQERLKVQSPFEFTKRVES